MKNIIGRSLPDSPSERRALFKQCKKLRLIAYRNDDDVLTTDAWLKIHPMIVGFVNDEVIAALSEPSKENGSTGIDEDVFSASLQTETTSELEEKE